MAFLRGIAVWHRKLDPARFPRERLHELLARLAEAEPPSFRLAESAIHAHSRHYMPGKGDKRTLVFDAFARVADGDPVVIVWLGLVLDAPQSEAKPHSIAEVFHRAGLIEKWGRGTNRVADMSAPPTSRGAMPKRRCAANPRRRAAWQPAVRFPPRRGLWPAPMKHDEFRIGQVFRCAGKRWRCTDLGTRVIVAICLEPHEVATLDAGKDAPAAARERRHVTDDPSWFTGPPYAVVEEAFDEDSIQDCLLDPGDR